MQFANKYNNKAPFLTKCLHLNLKDTNSDDLAITSNKLKNNDYTGKLKNYLSLYYKANNVLNRKAF